MRLSYQYKALFSRCVVRRQIRRMGKTATVKKPVSYCYMPYFGGEGGTKLIEVWQVLEDEVLGVLYPWQYGPAAQTSSRIETLNFLALTQFEEDSQRYPDVRFVYKISSRLLGEGNVHRLAGMLKDNLVLCFDIFQLEAFGDRNSRIGLNFLTKRGAHVMIEGIERAPMDVIAKYNPEYFLLDYRYYNQSNFSLLSIFSNIANQKGVKLVLGNAVNKNNVALFEKEGVAAIGGSAYAKPKKKLETLLGKAN